MSRNVPYLDEEEIERDAVNLLAEFEHERADTVEPPIPIEDIVEKHLKLRIEFDDLHARHNVPRLEDGQTDILGAYYGDGSIFIDQTLDPDEYPEVEERYRFTVAHELGHFRYHRNLLKDGGLLVAAGGKDVRIAAGEDEPDTGLRPAEWQANRFAACILVPLPALVLEWLNWMKSLRPFVFEEYSRDPRWWSPSERRDALLFRDQGVRPNHDVHAYAFNKVAGDLAPIFRVSVATMRFRLQKVGLLSVGNEIQPPTLRLGALGIGYYSEAAQSRLADHGRLLWR